jgi:hypothetical protein
MDPSFTLVIAGLLILTMVLVTLALNRRPTEPLILAIQAAAVALLAAYAIHDRPHRYITLVFVLIGAVNLGRRLRVKYRP